MGSDTAVSAFKPDVSYIGANVDPSHFPTIGLKGLSITQQIARLLAVCQMVRTHETLVDVAAFGESAGAHLMSAPNFLAPDSGEWSCHFPQSALIVPKPP